MTDTNTTRDITTEELQHFWKRRSDGPDLADVPAANTPALRRLGPSPFSGAGFPVLGFLETVYEQIASHGAASGADASIGRREP